MNETDANQSNTAEKNVYDKNQLSNGSCLTTTIKSPAKESENEDTFSVIEIGSNNVLLVVADGMGGHRGGSFASKKVVDRLTKAVKGKSKNLHGHVINGIEKAHHLIKEKGIGAGSTIAAALIERDSVRFFNVGDSLGVLVGGLGAVKYKTIEHSPFGFAVESGLVEPESNEMEDQRHFVSNVLGHGEIRIEISQKIPLAQKDNIVLGSDGFFSNISEEAICESLRTNDIELGFSSMIDITQGNMANAKTGHPDDLTAILWRGTNG